MLCGHFGETLPNHEFIPFHASFPEEFDRAFARLGVPEEMVGQRRHLMYRGSPIALPDPEDWPVIGYFRADEIDPALGALVAVDLSVLDNEIRTSAEQLKVWLEACVTSACDLVCFYG